MSEWFADDYPHARQRFVQLGRRIGATMDSLAISATGPDKLRLTTDIAWIGSSSPKKAIVVQSGVHGVEAFAGSAVQCHLLEHSPLLEDDTAMILVHVLNPFGMAWLRRVNESNVDLNRNYLVDGQEYSGASNYYHRLNRLINPQSAPRFDLFTLKALYQVIRHGMEPLRQAIAQGQYEYPMGLFYGGAALEEELYQYHQWVVRYLNDVERLMVIDLHTGLGGFGRHQVFSALPLDGTAVSGLGAALGSSLILNPGDTGGYEVEGGIANLFAGTFPRISPSYLTVEFGTYSQLKVLHALREENRGYFHAHTTGNKVAVKLKKALCPESPKWRSAVVKQGAQLVSALIARGVWC